MADTLAGLRQKLNAAAAEISSLNEKIDRLRAAKNAYKSMAGYAPMDMAGAHTQGDIYSARRKQELRQQFDAIKDEE